MARRNRPRGAAYYDLSLDRWVMASELTEDEDEPPTEPVPVRSDYPDAPSYSAAYKEWRRRYYG